MDEPSILLTNDDGVDAPGLRAVFDALADVGDVTVVAPAEDMSAVGRSLSREVTVREHELGYSIDGTPSDCVVAGLSSLVPETDLVVAGCNEGANLGAYVLGRSGTVSAAVEATFFEAPAVAVSMYVPVGADTRVADVDVGYESYAEAARATRYLVEHAPDSGVFDGADYLNVNAPVAEWGRAGMEITVPSEAYLLTATREADGVHLHDEIWDRMAEGDVPDPPGTDRRAVVEGNVSVSPLTAPHTVERHDALDALAETYADSRD